MTTKPLIVYSLKYIMEPREDRTNLEIFLHGETRNYEFDGIHYLLTLDTPDGPVRFKIDQAYFYELAETLLLIDH